MECNTCELSYNVRHITSNLPNRLSNHKSHIIKKGFRSCKLVSQFLDIDHSLYFSTIASFTIVQCPLTLVLTLQWNYWTT